MCHLIIKYNDDTMCNQGGQTKPGQTREGEERERAEEGWAEQGKATISPLGIHFWASTNPYTIYTTAIGTIRPGTHTHIHTHRPSQHIADTHTYIHMCTHVCELTLETDDAASFPQHHISPTSMLSLSHSHSTPLSLPLTHALSCLYFLLIPAALFALTIVVVVENKKVK